MTPRETTDAICHLLTELRTDYAAFFPSDLLVQIENLDALSSDRPESGLSRPWDDDHLHDVAAAIGRAFRHAPALPVWSDGATQGLLATLRAIYGGAISFRPSWDSYFMDMAHLVATRATCDRKHVGAVVVRDKRVVATGYNGSPPGLPHCDVVGHDLVRQADGKENCVRTVHAEMNAILQAAQYGVSLAGTTLYTNTYPCWHCAKAILGARIATVVVDQDYNNDARVAEAFKASGVRLVTLAEVGRGGVCPSRCPRPSRTASSRRPTLKAHG